MSTSRGIRRTDPGATAEIEGRRTPLAPCKGPWRIASAAISPWWLFRVPERAIAQVSTGSVRVGGTPRSVGSRWLVSPPGELTCGVVG
jgi:hypothetical protein